MTWIEFFIKPSTNTEIPKFSITLKDVVIALLKGIIAALILIGLLHVCT
jgi:hypothetical protein